MASNDPSPNGTDREVLGSLPNARPQRRSAKRDRAKTAPATATKPRPAKPKAAKASTPPARAPKAPPVPPAGYATPRGDDDGPGGVDLVTTALQAVGELAQIGIAAGGRALKSVADRVPRP